jgi:hypothetical protein
VRDAFAMCFIECVGNLNGVFQFLIHREGTFHQPSSQCLAFEIFHHQEIGFVLVAYIVESADVGMIQAGNGFGFTLEALAQFGSIGKMIRQILMATMRSKRVTRAQYTSLIPRFPRWI